MSKNKVLIKIDLSLADIPLFGTWKWVAKDYKTPLTFYIDKCKVKFLLQDPIDDHKHLSTPAKRKNLEIMHNSTIEIEYDNPPADFIRGLKTSGKLSFQTAKKIYSIYEQVMYQFEMTCRTIGGMKHFMGPPLKKSFDLFFDEPGYRAPVRWCYQGKTFQNFKPKIPKGNRKRNPLFKKKELITKDKWIKMNYAISVNDFPQEEILQILRIQSEFLYNKKKFAVLECSIMLEAMLVEHSYRILRNKWQSNNKMKDLKDELSFNNVLNIVLPLSLSGSKFKKMKESLAAVNALRKIRNRIIHGEIKEKDIDRSVLEKGIDGGVKLVKYLIKQ
ncbi:MAG: hypothetical protein KKB81_01605 [Candidatus Margulisbacteria bacterium]|nr:hypothetical protein [Candidatus Margulisiibacteriota bacterium]MBU1021611.1 hypothetical protein [Candidatus Margulisiibacteriota bacterium]MBU1728762.1 hypothetical protein [Candidatus Margulisiibacteriota bacterium]MBU1955728.1 hypothetical protein [Candidatus Margulisiibacteriota bacterium]